MPIDESYDATETVRHCEAPHSRSTCAGVSAGVLGPPRDDDGAATHWYGKWLEVSVERDEAIADRDRWRDSWERGDWSRAQWVRERAQECSPDRQHRYWPWGADDTCGVAVQDPGTRSMRACRRPKNDPLHSEGRADV